MPIYDYQCDAGHGFERLVPLASFTEPQACQCGAPAARRVSAPHIRSDYMEPSFGGDGKRYDSRAAWEASLKGVAHVVGNDEIKPDKPPCQKAKIREAIKAGIEDVKNGRVPPCYNGVN